MIRAIKPYMSINTLKIIYFSYFHSVMTYGLIFWGNSSLAESVFRIQKKALRLMMGYGYRETCRDLFKELHILLLKSQYIYPLMMFVIKNGDIFITNRDYHHHVRWVPCHHSMARPQVADGGNGLQVWRVAANILIKLSRTANKGWPSSFGLTTPHRKK
jgi:hypothetical protein